MTDNYFRGRFLFNKHIIKKRHIKVKKSSRLGWTWSWAGVCPSLIWGRFPAWCPGSLLINWAPILRPGIGYWKNCKTSVWTSEGNSACYLIPGSTATIKKKWSRRWMAKDKCELSRDDIGLLVSTPANRASSAKMFSSRFLRQEYSTFSSIFKPFWWTFLILNCTDKDVLFLIICAISEVW